MKNYSNTAAQVALTGAVTASTTTLPVSATTGFPAVQFTLALDLGAVNEELVLVTAVAGLNLTVVRGYDSTTAVAHGVGATVVHSHSGEDFGLSRQHEASTAAHGVTGAVVGTTNAQTLTNKDLTSGTNAFPSSLATDAEVTSAVATHNSAPDVHGVTGGLVGATNTQTLTNKTLGATNTLNGFGVNQLLSSDGTGRAVASGKAVPSGVVVGTTDVQTLTNKTLTSPAMTDPTASGSLTGFGGAWTAYAPTWTDSATNPVIGNGTLSGAYLQVGKTVFYRIDITMGSTTTYGSGGVYAFGLPVAARSGLVNMGHAHLLDISPGSRYLTVAFGLTSTTIALVSPTSASAAVNPTNPFTFASGDGINITGTYEAA